MEANKPKGSVTRDLDALATEGGGERIVKFLHDRFSKLLRGHKHAIVGADDLFAETLFQLVKMVQSKKIDSRRLTSREQIASYFFGIYQRVLAQMSRREFGTLSRGMGWKQVSSDMAIEAPMDQSSDLSVLTSVYEVVEEEIGKIKNDRKREVLTRMILMGQNANEVMADLVSDGKVSERDKYNRWKAAFLKKLTAICDKNKLLPE